MQAPKITDYQKGEEAVIQLAVIDFLTLKGWFVKSTHGNMYQSGFPDLWASHHQFGSRWIEVKKPKGYSFTAAQLRDFPKMCAFGSGVWIMTGATEDQYRCLFKPCNWSHYLSMLHAGG